MRKRQRVGSIFITAWGFGLAAILGLIACLSASPLGALSDARLFILLGVMAIVAEFVPVELSSRGIRVTFSLPYVAAMAIAVSPSGAVLIDVLATVLAAVAYSLGKNRKIAPLWLAMNASVACLSVLAAVGAMRIGAFFPHFDYAIATIAFLAAYGGTNFFLVAFIDNVVTGRPLADNVLSSLKVGLPSVALYGVLALAVSIFAHKAMPFLVPITLVPILALRAGLAFRATMYEHYYETVAALSLMLQRAHPYTHGHLERVALSAEEVAKRLGLSSTRARMVREAAVLHDIGKIAVSEKILDKPAKLTDEEMEHVRRHSAMGAQILAPVRQFHEMAPWIRHHHERPDGKGYPDRLSDVEIPIESKIIAVVDAYDAMTGGDKPGEKRTYRESMSAGEALAELERCSGTQFDVAVVKAFREVILGGEDAA